MKPTDNAADHREDARSALVVRLRAAASYVVPASSLLRPLLREAADALAALGVQPPPDALTDEQIDRVVNESREKEWTTHQFARAILATQGAVPPVAWMGVGAVTGKPIVVLADEPRSHNCAPWVPLYALQVPPPDPPKTSDVDSTELRG